ncbi:aspartic proteinase-like protein 2 [Cucurbita maxima]|uniref:Aspartic proteinase-like protein 2 n=1 Tax=Cucurbita maxima TaxID=3661 RepID=A0A6J1IBA4_CUCMA|nr:aspartic proteinase-like protein 2 [Cucurbita maxima]
MEIARLAVVSFLLVISLLSTGDCNLVFNVHHKFKGRERSLEAFKAHDVLRRGRFLSAIDLNLGGNGHPSESGLYFAKIGLGTPAKDYYVQVDTGSDLLWVNCAGCTNCPRKSDLGIELTLYNPSSSSTSNLVTCGQDFCTSTYDGPIPGCRPELLCEYKVAYGDGSSTTGYFVKDHVVLDRVTGNFKTESTNGSIVFGCGAQQSVQLGATSAALDGILGFGQANSSMISQLASSGKIKRIFAHCLDNINGGGIFAIGEVVQPKVRTTPLVQQQAHYNVFMKAIEVGDEVLNLPTDVFDTDLRKGTIIDSGTTLAYLPDVIYEPLIAKIFARQTGLKLHTVEEQFTCFEYDGNVDDGFPTITFHFEDSLSLTVHPHEYLFDIASNKWCVGWQNSGAQSRDGKDMILLGDLVLQNRLVLYDLENQTIGWTEYNCSSSIKVRDEHSGAIYTVGPHNLYSASSVRVGTISSMLLSILLLLTVLHSFTN